MDSTVLKKIIQNLKSELQLQNGLLELLTHERSEIVHLKSEELNKIREKKEGVLTKISINKSAREELMAPLPKPENPKDKLTLSKVFSSAPQEIKSTYDSIYGELKKTLEAVQKLNTENSGLLKQSLGLVTSTISILSARPSVENNNYQKDGSQQNKESESLSNLGGPVSSFNRSV